MFVALGLFPQLDQYIKGFADEMVFFTCTLNDVKIRIFFSTEESVIIAELNVFPTIICYAFV